MNRSPLRRALMVLVLAGCLLWAGVGAGEAASAKVVFALFDLSGSTDVAGVRKSYYEDFKKVLDAIHPGDGIVGDAITDNPLAQSSFPIKEEFEKYNPLVQNPLVHAAKVREQKERVLKAAEEILIQQRRGTKSTKILDSLHLAERIFGIYGRDRKVLVLFSDMIEESEQYNFVRDKLTDSRIGQIIARERARKRLPELGGVRVYVTGASAGGYQGMSSEAMFRVRDFWLRYFKECGADLARGRYGSSLPKFEE